MFSLIITIISIALVAVLAVATIYYGGTAFTEGQKRAKASEISAKGQQVMAATMLYHQSKLVWPATPEDLVTEGYLKSIPDVVVAANDGPGNPLVSTAHAESSAVQWSFLSATAKHLLVEGTTMPVPEDVCREVNKQQSGFDGVLTTLDDSVPIQCVETATADEFMVVFLNPEQVAPGSTDPVLVTDGTVSQVCYDFLAAGNVSDCDSGVISDNRDNGGGEGEGGGGGGSGLPESEISGSLGMHCSTDFSSVLECRMTNYGNQTVRFTGWNVVMTDDPASAPSTWATGTTGSSCGKPAGFPVFHTAGIPDNDPLSPAGYQVFDNDGYQLAANETCSMRMSGPAVAFVTQVLGVAQRYQENTVAQLYYFAVDAGSNWQATRNLSDIDAIWPGAVNGGGESPSNTAVYDWEMAS